MTPRSNWSLLPNAGLILLFWLLSATALAQPSVIVSIKPLELLVRAIADDQVTVSTLVPDGASPHTYQMRPSERRRLEEASLVFWVGPDMETFLIRLLGSAELQPRAIMLAPGDVSPDSREQSHDHLHEHDHHHHDGEDPHLWVDPAMGLLMAAEMADRLGQLEGVSAERIQERLATFRQALAETEQTLQTRLAAARHLDLFTYHDAFGRFARHYDLKQAGVLTLNPERTPGARHLNEVRSRLLAAGHPCLLTEPQFNRQWWRTVTEGVPVPLSPWDPLAIGIPADADGYIRFQLSIADSVLGCLPEHSEQQG